MFFFRVDLGEKSGLGHYARIKSLINYLNIKKYKIVIDKICKNKFFISKQNEFISLYEKNQLFSGEEDDAQRFLKKTKCNPKDSIIIKDSYRLGNIWEKKIYNKCKKIITIEDDIYKKHYVDYYINHNPILGENQKTYNILKKNNKKNCKFLLGKHFALFDANSKVEQKIKSDFLFYNGGSGNPLVYENVIKKLLKISNEKTIIALIVGPLVKKNIQDKILKKFKKSNNIKLVLSPNSILSLIKNTRVFISSAGISAFESSYLKRPTLLFSMNSNQNLFNTSHEKLGHYFFLKKKDLKEVDKVACLISLFIKNINQIKKMMNKNCLSLSKIKKNYKQNIKL